MKNRVNVYRGTIMVDIDGVLANFEESICDAFGYINRHMYNIFDRHPDVPKDLITEYIENPANYVDLEPIFGGLLFCHQARSRGWYVLLCTSRPGTKEMNDTTIRWLEKYRAEYHQLHFAQNKAKFVKQYDLDNPDRPIRIVVDDSVSVLQSLQDKYAVAWEQEWNQGYYPKMYYSMENMKIMVDDGIHKPQGAWDMVGKR